MQRDPKLLSAFESEAEPTAWVAAVPYPFGLPAQDREQGTPSRQSRAMTTDPLACEKGMSGNEHTWLRRKRQVLIQKKTQTYRNSLENICFACLQGVPEKT